MFELLLKIHSIYPVLHDVTGYMASVAIDAIYCKTSRTIRYLVLYVVITPTMVADQFSVDGSGPPSNLLYFRPSYLEICTTRVGRQGVLQIHVYIQVYYKYISVSPM